MIVKYNQEEYSNLFIEAYKFLKDKGVVPADNNKIGIQSLPEYYSHMNDFFVHNGWEYIFLPLDEKVFEIKLNDRSISVPSEFREVTVQSDTMAEMFIFEVDRYFDYMDLANTNIYVQWKTPNEKGDGRATRIKMIDRDSVPGKLRFAWPISNELTKEPGNVKFSVRFFMVAPDQDDEQKMIYSLNTKEASFNVVAAHQSALNKKANVEFQSDDLFNQIIINSAFGTSGVEIPLTPEFFADKNISIYVKDAQNKLTPVEQANLNAQDTLELYAEALNKDNNNIDYVWYYVSNTPTYVKFTDKQKFNDNPNAGYFIKNESGSYIPAIAWVDDGIYQKQYLFKVEDLDGYAVDNNTFIPFSRPATGWVNVPGYKYYETANITASVIDLKKHENTQTLYRKFSKLQVLAEDASNKNVDKIITGKYYVTAQGVNKDANDIKSVHSTKSSECELPSPNTVEITNNLFANKIVDVSSVTSEGQEAKEVFNSNNAALAITLKTIEDSVDEPRYQWFSSDSNPYNADGTLKVDSLSAIEKENNSSYIPKARGWYAVKVQNVANRAESEAIYSAVAKVTANPVAPVITIDREKYEDLIKVQEIKDTGMSFKVLIQLDKSNDELYCEELEYKWECSNTINENRVWHELPNVEHYKTEIVGNEATLTVYNTLPEITGFRLTVINKLNGASAPSEVLHIVDIVK